LAPHCIAALPERLQPDRLGRRIADGQGI
jgi:hypothetical protein